MKKQILILAAFLLSSSAFADSIQNFKCRSTEKVEDVHVSIQFQMRITPSGQFRYVDPDQEALFKVTPKDSVMSELNENGAIHSHKDGIEFFGDGDGFVFVYLVLYKDSGYTAGYLRIQDGGGGTGNFYSPVTCQVTEQ